MYTPFIFVVCLSARLSVTSVELCVHGLLVASNRDRQYVECVLCSRDCNSSKSIAKLTQLTQNAIELVVVLERAPSLLVSSPFAFNSLSIAGRSAVEQFTTILLRLKSTAARFGACNNRLLATVAFKTALCTYLLTYYIQSLEHKEKMHQVRVN